MFDKSRTTLIQFSPGQSGGYDIPESVTYIRNYAFSSCVGLTSISIPNSVVGIDSRAFSGCTGLIAIHVGQGAFGGSSKLTQVTLPNGISSIGLETFHGCSALTTVTIPASVSTLPIPNRGRTENQGSLLGAFENCTNLLSAIFLGDAPTCFDDNTFANTAPDFTIYYLSSSTGFTSLTWNGYRTVMLDESTYPTAPWLVSHDFPQDTNLNQDLNGDGIDLLMTYALDLDPPQNLSGSLPRDTDLHQDLNNEGVDLLMAYALNLNPSSNLSKQMPAPVLDGDALTLSFNAAAPGVTYTVETSTDLETWTTDGVVISEFDANKHRTASVPLNTARRFLRLVVSDVMAR